MKQRPHFWNVLRIVSPGQNEEVKALENLYTTPISEVDTPEQNLVLMISKLIYMIELLSVCVKTNKDSIIEQCQLLAGEIRRHERLATSGLVDQASVMGKTVFKIAVRFPSRIERIAIMLGNILDCCRIKAAERGKFSDEAQEELSEIFQVASGMLRKLRDTLVVPNRFLLGQIRFDGQKLEHLVEDARLANWERMEARVCHPHRASIYVEILDSFKYVNEYMAKMSENLLDLARLDPKG
jgi:Na+/phosphate symporter